MFKKLYEWLKVRAGLYYARRMAADEKGASSVEYALMVALVAAVVIAGATLLGNAVNDQLVDVGGKIAPTPPAP